MATGGAIGADDWMVMMLRGGDKCAYVMSGEEGWTGAAA